MKPDSEFKIPGFNIYRIDRSTGAGGGIMFAVKKKLSFSPIKINVKIDPTVETAAIKINGFAKPMNIFAVYRAPGVDNRTIVLSQEQWDSVANLASKEEGINYLVGDFNAHNVQWNCDDDDLNGKRFLDSIMDAGLIILNYDQVTHLNSRNGKTSIIDLVMADNNSASVATLRVYDETYESDHFPIEISVSLSKYIYRKKSFKVRSTRTKIGRRLTRLWNIDILSFLTYPMITLLRLKNTKLLSI